MPKISELPAGTPATGTELIPADQAGTTVKLILAKVATTASASDLTSGTLSVVCLPAVVRQKLLADTIYYVRKDGSDSNSGLADNAAGAFLTIGKAVKTVANGIDLNGFIVTIQVRVGTYAENVLLLPYIGRGGQGHSNPLIQGEASDHTLVKIAPASGICVLGVSSSYCEWTLKNLEIDATANSAVIADAGSWVCIDGVVFGGTATTHIAAENSGILEIVGNYTIAAGAQVHVSSQQNGLILYTGNTVTLTGIPAFSAAFAYVDNVGFIEAAGVTFSGAATGTRFIQDRGGAFQLSSADPNSIFPGSVNGAFTPLPVAQGGTGTTAAGQLPATATNDNAIAGKLGEYVSSTVVTGSAVSLTTGVVTNITSISLTAGDWDVWINGYFNPANTTQINAAYVSIATANNALDQTAGKFGLIQNYISNGQSVSAVAGPYRISLSGSASVYFNVYAGFTTSTLTAWGIIQARRVR